MKYPGMVIHCFGVILSGIWISSIVFKSIWPDIKINPEKQDHVLKNNKYQPKFNTHPLIQITV